MIPAVGLRMPVSILIVVVFPAPLGPSKAKISPDFIDKLTSFTANFANNIIRVQGIGEGRNATHAVNSGLDLTGSMDWQLTDPDFFKYLFIGQVTGAGSAADQPPDASQHDLGLRLRAHR